MVSIDQLIRSAMADHQAGRLAEAETIYRQVLSIEPGNYHALHFLGIILSQKGQPETAIDLIQRSLTINPNQPSVWCNLNMILAKLNRFDEAVDACQRAIALRPNYTNAHNSLGSLLANKGQLKEALACFREALRHQPQFVLAHSNILFTLHFLPDASPESILAEAQRWERDHALPLARFARPHAPDLAPGRPLRVGYVSSDFRWHCQSLFTMPLLREHDRERFEIFCYSGVMCPDEVTKRLQPLASVWRSTVGLSDEVLAEQIREDRIDILVDLAMHMAGNRLLVFARKPAPVQVVWLAYPGTTGLSAIDYRLTDPYMDPPEHDGYYIEKSIRLPNIFWCYDPRGMCLSEDEVLPIPSELPAIRNNHITFGCLNNFCKINDEVIAAWACVLQKIPASRIILLAPPGDHRQRLIDRLSIDPARVEFMEYRPRQAYLQLYDRIDISLDTFPYNGHTTSLDSLWMGVPVVNLVGRGAPGRAGLSQLTNLGLTELVADSPDQFVQIAAELAADLPRLKRLRSTLRQRMEQSPLMDARGFARGIEAAYRQMWAAGPLAAS